MTHTTSAAAEQNTFIDLLLTRATETPDQVAFTFLHDTEGKDVTLTYEQLYRQAAGFAAILQQHGLQGERVLLVFKSNQFFIIAFFACLMAGAIAVPTSPPRRQHLAKRLSLLAENAGARAGIPDSDEVMQAAVGFGKHDVHWFDIRELSRNGQLTQMASQWKQPALQPDDLAFLQYTSGTTGEPKGVMISHRNLMANSAIIHEAFGHHAGSVGLIGLPLFHDMGLIGGVLQPLYGGFPVHLMTPAQLVQKPERWLRLISERRVTTSGGPNFMYDLALRSVRDEQLEGLDLSSWKVAFCGAEPVRAKTMQDFSARFGAYGFQPASFYPCYGMAEATLFVTGSLLEQCAHIDTINAGQASLGTVSCGRPRRDTHVLIVDPGRRMPVAAGTEGEIWVSGESNAQGYWHRPKESEETFGAHLASGEGPFMRTGDLGYLRNGELFVSGRMKDLIILRGRNVAPQDLEVEAEQSHAELRPGCSAAFTAHVNGNERLVYAAELNREGMRNPEHWPEIEKAVRAAVAENYQVRIDDIVLMAAGALPKTSSGKVKRSQCRIDFVAGRLPSVREKSAIEA